MSGRMSASMIPVFAATLISLLMPAAAGAALPDGPAVVSRYKNGPVALSGGGVYTEVAALPLKAGVWYVRATAYLADGGGTGKHLATCKLTMGSGADAVSASLTGAGGGKEQSLLLTMARKFSAPGKASLSCTSNVPTGQVTAGFIKLTGVEIGKLTTVPFGGTATTVGTGTPRVISGYRTAYKAVAADSQNHLVAKLALPAGRWWVLAKGVVGGASAAAVSEVTCTLAAGTYSDETRIGAAPPGSPADLVPMSLQVTADLATKGDASLVCTSATGKFKVGKLRITAFQAGTLTTGMLGGVGTTTGTGNPVVVSGKALSGYAVTPGTLTKLTSLALPAGKYAVSVTGWVGHVSGASIETKCQLHLEADYDESRVVQDAGALKAAPMMLQGVHNFLAPGEASLWCAQTGSSGQIGAYDMQVTAVRAGSLSNGGL